MLQWLRLAVWLLLSATVSGKEVKCDDLRNGYGCWDSEFHSIFLCWGCTIKNQHITENEVTIAPTHWFGILAANVHYVIFQGGNVTKLPNVIRKDSSKQVLRVQLNQTNTRLINAQFFGNGAQNLIVFYSSGNDNLSVEASAFQNCTELEILYLYDNGISSIPPDAFRGLNKLVKLYLNDNQLTDINENLFVDLANLEHLDLSKNQLVEIPDAAFDQMRKLRWLNLNRNKIEIVRRRMFHNNQQLQRIHLFKNQIKMVQSGSFANLDKLSWLDLSGNKCIDRLLYGKNPEEFSAALNACLPKFCLIPLIPNGYIVNIDHNATQIVGDSSEEYNPVKVVCLPSFSLFHERANHTENECQNEVWKDEQWAECHRK